MANIYILEHAAEPKQIQTQNGTMTRQTLTLREVDGNSQYTQRYVAEYLGPGDLRAWEGHAVATSLYNRYSKTDKGEFMNLQCREVISFGKPSA